ncbi:hypothetical protein VNO78_10702 [Psophocarpus tetragonolobus]|uniref:Pentatricopeptide repeat-containing protein n=1 Tax=Psophocarpus tetragonolobus TaxID=3891 RepID=A0AAN9XN85_PSOTE
MSKQGLLPDVTFNSRISALCRAGKVLEASRIFRDMQMDAKLGLPRPNVVTFNLMLKGFCKQGMMEDAKGLVDTMKKVGVFDTLKSYNIWLLALVRNWELLEATRLVLDAMVTKGFEPLWKEGRTQKAKEMLQKMNEKSYQQDTVACNIVVNGLCRNRELDKASEIDMERNGCNKTRQTYNALIMGLGSRKQIFEISSDIFTYNNIINSRCEGGKEKDVISLLQEMLDKGITSNISSFKILIKAFCKSSDFKGATELFEVALSICGHKEALYNLMFNELFAGGQLFEAKQLFEALLDRYLALKNFMYKDLIERLCKMKD